MQSYFSRGKTHSRTHNWRVLSHVFIIHGPHWPEITIVYNRTIANLPMDDECTDMYNNMVGYHASRNNIILISPENIYKYMYI